jgi:hypothetical protein
VRRTTTAWRGVRLALVTLGALLWLAAASVRAAVPLKDTGYSGRTSQGRLITVFVDRDGEIDNAEGMIDVHCASAVSVRVDQFAVGLPVSLTGRFGDVEHEAGLSDFERVTKGGTTGLDLTEAAFAGRFVSRREAKGTWRLQTMILSPGAFPYDPSLLDSCDSGVVTWTVRLDHRR